MRPSSLNISRAAMLSRTLLLLHINVRVTVDEVAAISASTVRRVRDSRIAQVQVGLKLFENETYRTGILLQLHNFAAKRSVRVRSSVFGRVACFAAAEYKRLLTLQRR